jgi:hypothetical protein
VGGVPSPGGWLTLRLGLLWGGGGLGGSLYHGLLAHSLTGGVTLVVLKQEWEEGGWKEPRQ